MQPSPGNTGNRTGRSWLHRPSTILVLGVVIEALVVLMGFASRFAGVLQLLAGIACVLLIGMGVNMLSARSALPAGPDSDGSRFWGQFSRSQKLFVAVLIVVAISFCMPIWHWHGDFAGQMHGHPIWVGEHVH